MRIDMGLGKLGLGDPKRCFKKKYRWLLEIPSVCTEGVNVLYHSKASRPSVQFKEIEAIHQTETIMFPGRPEWKPIVLTLYDTKTKDIHPVFEWLKTLYNPDTGSYGLSSSRDLADNSKNFKKFGCYLSLYDGCGNMIEGWRLDNVWCQNLEFGELDMQLSEVVTCEVSLRYDRAYWQAKRD